MRAGKGWRIGVVSALLVVGVLWISGRIWGGALLHMALATQGIVDFESSGVQLGIRRFGVEKVSAAFTTETGVSVRVHGEGSSVAFSWREGPVISELASDRLDIAVTLADTMAGADTSSALDIPALAQQVDSRLIPTTIRTLEFSVSSSSGTEILSYVGGVQAEKGEITLLSNGVLTLGKLPGFTVPKIDLRLVDSLVVRLTPEGIMTSPVQIAVSELSFPAESTVQEGILSIGEVRSKGRALEGQITARGRGRLGAIVPDGAPFQIVAQARLDPTIGYVPAIEADASIPLLNAGVSLKNISSHASLGSAKSGGARFEMGPIVGSVLGGTVTLKPVTWTAARAPQLFSLGLSEISLEELFRAYPSQTVQGTGLLDGEVPISIGSGGVSVTGGSLRARAPGGVLAGDLSTWAASYPGNQGISFAAAALKNLHYTKLEAAVGYTPSGDLSLGVTIQGKNPEVAGSRPINLNVVVSENIPALMKTMGLLQGEGMSVPGDP